MKRLLVFILSMVASLAMMTAAVQAEGELAVYNHVLEDETLSVYIDTPGGYEHISCQIGQVYVDNIDIKTGTDISIDTYIIIDNSNSILDKYRETLRQVAKYLVYGSQGNERFTIATFDTQIHYLTEKNNDTQNVAEIIDQIVFQDLDTKVIDVLLSLYDKIDADKDNSFKRIIFMSDCVDTKPTAYTQEELVARVRNSAYPIYALGCTFQSNATQLQNMFRLSRETNGKYYFLDEISDVGTIGTGIEEALGIAQVNVSIPENQMDGGTKGIRVIFETQDGEKTAYLNANMPFLPSHADEDTEPQSKSEAQTAEEQVTEPVNIESQNNESELISETQELTESKNTELQSIESESISETRELTEAETAELQSMEIYSEIASKEENNQVKGDSKDSNIQALISNPLVLCGIAILILIIVIIILAVKFSKKKKAPNVEAQSVPSREIQYQTPSKTIPENKENSETKQNAESDYESNHNVKDSSKTSPRVDKSFVNAAEDQYADTPTIIDEEEKTFILGSDTDEPTLLVGGKNNLMTIRLIDKNNPSETREFPLESNVIIGRCRSASQIVFDKEKSVSGKHCEIYRDGEKLYIRDLGSSNGTYVDEKLINEPVEIKNGQTIGLGRLQLEVQVDNDSTFIV